MKPKSILVPALVVIATIGAVVALEHQSLVRAGTTPHEATEFSPNAASMPTLDVRALLEPGPRLLPSQRARELAGRKVTLEGYMAEMELPPKAGFFLTEHPVHCDEAGAGTADLPPATVLVLAPPDGSETSGFVPGRLRISGVLELGNQPDAQGRTSSFRLRMESAPAGPFAARK